MRGKMDWGDLFEYPSEYGEYNRRLGFIERCGLARAVRNGDERDENAYKKACNNIMCSACAEYRAYGLVKSLKRKVSAIDVATYELVLGWKNLPIMTDSQQEIVYFVNANGKREMLT